MTSKLLYERMASTYGGSVARRSSDCEFCVGFYEKRVEKRTVCGYIPNVKDRAREKNSMVHVRFPEPERRKMKAICALAKKKGRSKP